MFPRSVARISKAAAVARRQISGSRSARGGGGGHHEELHHYHPKQKLGPYEVPHHPTYPNQAHPFGIDFKKGYKAEGWETITLLVYAGMFGMIFYGTKDEKEDDTFKTWAKREAIARMKVVEEGGEIEFGKYYGPGDGNVAYEASEDVGEPPKVAEK